MMTKSMVSSQKKRKPKHMDERSQKGITGILFPDLFAKHMAVDR